MRRARPPFTLQRRPVALLCLLAVVLLALPMWAPMRTSLLTAVLVPELIQLPIRPLAALVPEPTRITTSYGDPADRMDVYLPTGSTEESALPAVVLALGVHPQPIDHPDVTRIATVISRLGVVVAVPDSTPLRNLVLTADEPAHLADAVLEVKQMPQVDPERVGIAGFSAGASIALITAADPRLAGDLAFVSAFGGYADAEQLLVDVATSTAVIDEQVRPWQADQGIRADIATLLTGERAGANEQDRSAIAALMAASSRANAEAAIAGFSDELRAELSALSPIAFADQIRAPVFILHGDPDTAIPVGHATELERSIGDEVVRLTRFGQFGHGQPGADGLGLEDVPDVAALSLYLRAIVAAVTE